MLLLKNYGNKGEGGSSAEEAEGKEGDKDEEGAGGPHQHLILATLALIITVIFFQRRCCRYLLRMSASWTPVAGAHHGPWSLPQEVN